MANPERFAQYKKEKLMLIFLRFIILIITLIVIFGCAPREEIKERAETPPAAKIEEQPLIEVREMKLSSSAFKHGEDIPEKYTCEGDNISPPLKIEDIPAKAKSFVLIMDDPDAVKPAGKVWDHWIVFNIPPSTTEIKENTEPEGRQGKNSWGELGYGGPCPPDGQHRYYFKLYALDAELNLPAGATKSEIEKAMLEHILAKAELVGKYKR
ncbi:MAG: YbhB/YbcL family Raf kinase inhibitor-like protein [Nanoarchaeota archaeon]